MRRLAQGHTASKRQSWDQTGSGGPQTPSPPMFPCQEAPLALPWGPRWLHLQWELTAPALTFRHSERTGTWCSQLRWQPVLEALMGPAWGLQLFREHLTHTPGSGIHRFSEEPSRLRVGKALSRVTKDFQGQTSAPLPLLPGAHWVAQRKPGLSVASVSPSQCWG